MDEEEIKILNKLYDEKHIVYSPEKIIVTRKFYKVFRIYHKKHQKASVNLKRSRGYHSQRTGRKRKNRSPP